MNIQRLRQRAGVGFCGEQLHAQVAAPDASARVDARTEDKAEMVRRAGRFHVSNGGKGGKSRPRQSGKLRKPGAHERAVDADKRHDIADRGKRDEVGIGAQIRFGDAVCRVPTALPQRAIQRDNRRRRGFHWQWLFRHRH